MQLDSYDDAPSVKEGTLGPMTGPQVLSARRVVFGSNWRPLNPKTPDPALADRVASIFGLVVVEDPLNSAFATGDRSYLPSKKKRVTQSAGRKRFDLVPYQFLQKARRNRPERPMATASGFSQWIYSLYGSAFGKDDDRERGLALEPELIERRRLSACAADNAYLEGVGSDWKLVHSGLHDAGQKHVDHLCIPRLRVDGDELRASPDLIYMNEKRSEVIIVEIKNSRLEIPTNLWPNIWGQLWCYSQLEVARSAKKVIVVGEVWGESWYRDRSHSRGIMDMLRKDRDFPLKANVCLRASVRRNPRSVAYDRFFQALFDIYNGSDLTR